MRSLLRRLKRENWLFSRSRFDIDETGVGRAIYSMQGPIRTYSLICFVHDLPPELPSDRVIEEAWEATFTLFDGVPTAEDIERLSLTVTKREAGRILAREICLSPAMDRSIDHHQTSSAKKRLLRNPYLEAFFSQPKRIFHPIV